MKLLLSPFFLICSFIFWTHQIFEKGFDIHFSFFDNYLDSFLCLPVILSIHLAERCFFLNKTKYRFSVFEIVVISIALSIFFEEALPIISNRFTKDYYDYLALGLGALSFWRWGNN